MNIIIKQSAVPVLALLLGACSGNKAGSRSGNDGSQASTAGEKISAVEVVHPEQRNFTAEIDIVGTARPNQTVQLHAMESGYVKTLYKDIGDAVRQGEPIARLENPELMRQQQKQKALMEAKKSIYERLNRVAEKTPALTSLEQLENAKAAYGSALAEYSATADRVGFLNVKSPFTGVVTKRYVDKGALIQSGTASPQASPLVEVMELATIRLGVPLPESDVSAIRVGTVAEIVFPEIAGKVFQAKVSRISRALNPKAKTMDVEIDIPNSGLVIKPGMYARVKMQISSRENVLSLPNTALIVYQDDFFIYMVENGMVQRVPVRRGLHNKDYFELLDAAIPDTAQIIIRGKNLVQPGMKVEAIMKGEK